MDRTRPIVATAAVGLALLGATSCLGPRIGKVDRERVDAHIRNGQAYYGRGRLPQAEQQLRKALEIDRRNKKATLALGWTLLRQSDLARIREAESLLEGLVARTPGDYRAHQGLGTARLREILILDRGIERLKGLEGEHEGEIREARERLERLLDAAKGDFERVLELREDYPHALANLGQIAALRGDREDALGYLERYLVLAEQTRRYFESKKGRLAAEDELEIVDEKISTNIDKEVTVRDLIANIYFDMDQPTRSIDQLDRILAIRPSFTDAYLHRARCWQKAGDTRRAVEDLERFLRKTDREIDDPLVQTANTLLVDYRTKI